MGKQSKRNDPKTREEDLQRRRHRLLSQATASSEGASINEGDRVRCWIDNERGWCKGVVRKKGQIEDIRASDGSGEAHPQPNRYVGKTVYKVALDYADARRGYEGSIDLGNGSFLEQVTILDTGMNIVQIPHE